MSPSANTEALAYEVGSFFEVFAGLVSFGVS